MTEDKAREENAKWRQTHPSEGPKETRLRSEHDQILKDLKIKLEKTLTLQLRENVADSRLHKSASSSRVGSRLEEDLQPAPKKAKPVETAYEGLISLMKK